VPSYPKLPLCHRYGRPIVFLDDVMTRRSFRILIPLLFVIPALLIACGAPSAPATGSGAAIPFVGANHQAGTPEATAADPRPIEAETAGTETDANGIPVGFTPEGRPYRGNPDAPVVMETFSDYQCPYCGRFANETLPALLENQIAAGEVVFIYYDFPLNAIHPQAAAAANAARCAGESGAAAYWAMHDRLHVNTGEWSNRNANEVFQRYAEELNIAGDDFATCAQEDRYAEEVKVDLALGRSRGISSTPSFFLNGQAIIGAYPLEYFNQAIAAVNSGESVAQEGGGEQQGPTVKPTPATLAMDNIVAELGEPDAAVTIVEFTDYQCPYCARHVAATLPQLISEMVETGRVRYVIKDFPLDPIHPEARAAAVAARCAAEQGAYWEMHEALFTNQSEWGGLGAKARDEFVKLAAGLATTGKSVDMVKFEACLSDGRFDDLIQANQDEGISLGVNGTPGFFINGFPISGAQPFELFEYAIGLAEEGTLADAYVAAPQDTQAAPTPSAPVEIDTRNSPGIGDPDAPVVMIEFTDYQCPFCRRHFIETFPQIQAEYIDTGMVRYVFMEFPLTSIHPQAQLASEAALCANDQGAYMAMHDMLFGRQDEWAGREDAGQVFKSFAKELSLDSAAFARCLDGREQEARVNADMKTGMQLGVSGTPAFFLNGHFISGAQPFAVFQDGIDRLLADGG